MVTMRPVIRAIRFSMQVASATARIGNMAIASTECTACELVPRLPASYPVAYLAE